MPLFEESQIDFEVWCSCGAGLCDNSIANEKNDYREITVIPCERCAKIMGDDHKLAKDTMHFAKMCIAEFLLSGEIISEKWTKRFNAVLNFPGQNNIDKDK